MKLWQSADKYFSMVLTSTFLPIDVRVSAIFLTDNVLPILSARKAITFSSIIVSLMLLRCITSLRTMVLYIPLR